MSIIDQIRSLFGGSSNNENGEYSKRLNDTKKHYPFKAWRASYDEGLEQYTERNCAKAQNIFDTLISDLVRLGEDSPEEKKIKVFKKAIIATNKLNEEIEGLVETGEREDLCELTDKITIAAGLDPLKYGDGEGLASEWREW